MAKLYTMKGKDLKPRHVVVAVGAEEEGKVSVKFVGIHPSVEGKLRRGRPPKFNKPVPLAEMVEMTDTETTEDLLKAAEKVLLAHSAQGSTDGASEQEQG